MFFLLFLFVNGTIYNVDNNGVFKFLKLGVDPTPNFTTYSGIQYSPNSNTNTQYCFYFQDGSPNSYNGDYFNNIENTTLLCNGIPVYIPLNTHITYCSGGYYSAVSINPKGFSCLMEYLFGKGVNSLQSKIYNISNSTLDNLIFQNNLNNINLENKIKDDYFYNVVSLWIVIGIMLGILGLFSYFFYKMSKLQEKNKEQIKSLSNKLTNFEKDKLLTETNEKEKLLQIKQINFEIDKMKMKFIKVKITKIIRNLLRNFMNKNKKSA